MDLNEAVSCGMAVARIAASDPDRPAVHCAGYPSLDYRRLNARANQLVRVLCSYGLRRGDHVVLLCANRPEFAEVVVAAQRSGLVLSPANWHLAAEDIAYVIQDCGAKALIADSAFAEAAVRAVADASELAIKLAVGEPIDGFDPYAQTLDSVTDEDIADPSLGSLMFYTSGTTGRPKGVRQLSEASNFAPFIEHFGRLYGYREGDVALATGPLYHGGPMVMCAVVALCLGVTVVLMPRWDSEGCLRLIEDRRVSQAFFVPTMFHRLLALPESVRRRHDLSSLRLILHGGAPTPVADKQAMIDWLGSILTEVYGATEGFSVSVTSTDWLKKPGTVGRPAPGQLCILGEDLRPCAAGEVGTLYVRPSGVFEYFNDPEKTAACRHGEQITVGDMGYLDEDGDLFITGRSAELILSGGSNIYPAEIDHVLLEHPAVFDAASFGVEDAEWGEVIQAQVMVGEGATPSAALAEELIEYCRKRLGTLRTPRGIDFVESLPRSEAGKLLRTRLRDEYRQRRHDRTERG